MIDDCNVRALYLYIFFYIYTKYLIYKYVIITNENSIFERNMIKFKYDIFAKMKRSQTVYP